MKLTTRNLLIILGVLGAVYGITQLTKRTGRSKTLKAELVAIDTSQVSKVEIHAQSTSLVLSKEGDAWTVSLPNGNQKTAKKRTVVSLLTSLNTIKPGRLAAKSRDKWKDYAVDSTGTRVKVYEAGKVATDVMIGRFGMEGQQKFYTFVRLFADEEVYVANNFMGMSVSVDPSSYRNNEVLRLDKDSLRSVSFNYPDSAFRLVRGEGWYLEDQTTDSTAVESYLDGLGFVTSRNFYDSEPTQNPSYTIVFEFSDKPEVVIDAYVSADGIIFKSSENAAELFLDDAIAEKLLKNRSAFLPTSN